MQHTAAPKIEEPNMTYSKFISRQKMLAIHVDFKFFMCLNLQTGKKSPLLKKDSLLQERMHNSTAASQFLIRHIYNLR